MKEQEIKDNAPEGAEYYHAKLGYLKDVFGRRCKPRIYLDGQWKRLRLMQSLDISDFKGQFIEL